MQREQLDIVIVGGGMVGLAVARACAKQGRNVVVLEQHARPGCELSSHNSEVLHAGLYYPSGSLKARTCVAGHQRWLEYARQRGIPHRLCGKWVVASDADGESRLHALFEQGQANGVEDLKLIGRSQLSRVAPDLRATAALFSPATGIIDSHTALLTLCDEFGQSGGVIACAHRVTGLHAQDRVLTVIGPDHQAFEIQAAQVVLASGLGLPDLLASTTGFAPGYKRIYYWAKGHYFSYHGTVPFNRLVCPVPEPGGLGIHLTLDLAGQARFGPDVEWVKEPDWQADPDRHAAFVEAIRRYWPTLDPARLQPAWAGVRPKLSPSGGFQDFQVDGPDTHGAPGVWVLAGIESPGLTAAPALAEYVLTCLDSE